MPFDTRILRTSSSVSIPVMSMLETPKRQQDSLAIKNELRKYI